MKSLTIVTAAAAMLMGTVLSTTAKAELNYGPITNGTQCWNSARDPLNGFGYWGSCPNVAVAAVAHHVVHHHKKS
jgi:hypothetical protein